MQVPLHGRIVRVFIGENDRHCGRPLYEAIVQEAHRRGMAGATVLRGIMGFGANSRIHTQRVLRLSEDLPIVVEIVDSAEHVEAMLPWLAEVVNDGMVTVEEARVVLYRRRGAVAGSS